MNVITERNGRIFTLTWEKYEYELSTYGAQEVKVLNIVAKNGIQRLQGVATSVRRFN